MNKLTKIGASALAGSLVSVSAMAGELAVSGSWELTYKSDDNAQVASPFGSKSAISFNGSGDVDGLGTASFYAQINDNNPAGFTSHMISLDMGDMGTFGFDQGVGAYGASTIDDKSPTAWEESWHNTATSSGQLIHTGGSAGVLGYANTVAGLDVSFEYAPSVNASDSGDGATSGRATAAKAGGSNMNIAITSSSLMDGLSVGVGAGETSYDDANTAGFEDGSSVVGFANYTMGPITAGVTMSESNNVRAATTSANDGAREVTAMGVAFAVNENLSVSYNTHETTFKKQGAGPDVDQEATGIAIAYTMGGATLAIQNNELDNSAGVDGTNDEITEISLSLAF